MASPVLRNAMVEGYKKNAYKWFYEEYDPLPRPAFEEIAEKKTFKGAYTIETTAVSMGQPVEKAEGSAFTYKSPSEGYSVVISKKSYGFGAEFSKEAVEDHRVDDILKATTKTWAQEVMRLKSTLFANLFNNGGLTAGHDATFDNSISGVITDSSGDTIYDSKPFFNLTGNTRSSKNGGTYYNGHALALNGTNLETVYNLHVGTNNRNERDEIIPNMPDILYVPVQLKFAAQRLLESEWIPGSAQNDTNVWRGALTLVVDPFLTDTDAWFLGTRKKGIYYVDGGEPEIDFFEDKDTKGYKATLFFRFRVGVNNWRPWSGSNFSTS